MDARHINLEVNSAFSFHSAGIFIGSCSARTWNWVIIARTCRYLVTMSKNSRFMSETSRQVFICCQHIWTFSLFYRVQGWNKVEKKHEKWLCFAYKANIAFSLQIFHIILEGVYCFVDAFTAENKARTLSYGSILHLVHTHNDEHPFHSFFENT